MGIDLAIEDERLRAENARLREALERPIHLLDAALRVHLPDGDNDYVEDWIVEALKDLRRALQEAEDE